MGGLSSPPLTAAQVGAKTAELAAGSVGSYLWAWRVSPLAFGSTYAGSSMRPSGINGDYPSEGGVMVTGPAGASFQSGTWRALGVGGNTYGYCATLFLRIA